MRLYKSKTVLLLLILALSHFSCATSSQPPLQASPKVLESLRQKRALLQKEVRALKSKTSSSRKNVRKILSALVYPKTGIGALNAPAEKAVIRWKSRHAGIQLKGSLRVRNPNAQGARASIILKKSKKR